MYECRDCGCRFAVSAVREERHGLDCPPYEQIAVCPECGGTELYTIDRLHCRSCGALLTGGQTEYCDEECRERGEKLRMLARKRRRMRVTDRLSALGREIEAYNREHGTCYTYGQYVAYVQPGLRKGGK